MSWLKRKAGRESKDLTPAACLLEKQVKRGWETEGSPIPSAVHHPLKYALLAPSACP